MASPRAVARGIAAGRAPGTLAVPLALHVAARIAERDPQLFAFEPTQLANALRDLIDAVEPDGVPVCDPDILLSGCRTAGDVTGSAQLAAALEATRRLRASFGDQVALAAVIPGPAAIADRLALTGAAPPDLVVALGKEFLGATADLIVICDESEVPGLTLTTLANVARFHQAVALSHTAPRYGLPATVPVGLEGTPRVPGVVLTPAALGRDTDIALLSEWVAAARG